MRRLLPLALIPLFAGCGSHQCPAEKPENDLCGSGWYARFDGDDDSDLRPYPDPVHTAHQPFKSATTRYSPDYGGQYGMLLNTLDGFGTYAPMMVSFNDVIDPVSLPQTAEASIDPASPLFLVDLDAIRVAPNASFASVVRPVTAWYDAVQANVKVNSLSVAPWDPLEPQHEYALVITDRLKTWTDASHTAQSCISPSHSFNCVKSKSPVDPRLEDMRKGLRPLFDWLDGQGIARGDVSLALNFVTQSIPDELLDIHKQLDAVPAPKGVIDPTRVFTNVSDANGKLVPAVKDYFQTLFPPEGVDVNFDDYDFGAMGTIAYGYFPSQDFREPTFKLFITDGTDGHVHPQTTNDLEWLVVLPKPDPANGIAPPYKMVVFQHALTVCKETMVVIANEFAKRGMGMVGIDVVNHGSRSQTPDQCQIPALDFLQLDNPLATRESFRQTVVDQFQLVKMVKSLDLDLDHDGARDIDTDRLAYVSQSLGSIIGATFMAMEPDVGAGVLNVGGGGLYSVALSFFGSSGGAPTGPDAFQNLPTFLLDTVVILQTAVERADPINYALHVEKQPFLFDGVAAPPKSILLQEAVGDNTVGNFSTDALVREMGGAVAGPSVFQPVVGVPTQNTPITGNLAGGKATIAMSQFDPAKHSFLLTLDHPGAFCRGQMQAAEFVRSYLDNGVGTIVDPYGDAAITARCDALVP